MDEPGELWHCRQDFVLSDRVEFAILIHPVLHPSLSSPKLTEYRKQTYPTQHLQLHLSYDIFEGVKNWTKHVEQLLAVVVQCSFGVRIPLRWKLGAQKLEV